MIGLVDEVVALYDERGRPAGSAPRSIMRAQNLRHAATGVIVRDTYGRVFVHRRTPTKDVYPSRWDFTAGGVVLYGEDPRAAARRELFEELGVTSDLESLGESDYADDHMSYHAFRYVTTYDGPIVAQPEEVVHGAWSSIERLLDRIEDPDVLFMPDSVALFVDWLEERVKDKGRPKQGWDTVATVVEGRWLDRTPRYPDVAQSLVAECALMERLDAELPLLVPRPIVLDDAPVRVRHVLLPGSPLADVELTAGDGRRVGEFLRILHDVPTTIVDGSGVPDEWAARAELLATLERMLHRVLPLVPERHEEAARELLHQAAQQAPATLIHGDLGLERLLSQQGTVTAIVDWSDARVADPALDLAWVLYDTPDAFANAAASAYGVTDDELGRALIWHRFAPWYEVLWGVAARNAAFVDEGLKTLIGRLTR